MQELIVSEQMQIQGGSVTIWIIYAAIACAIYKIAGSSAGRLSVPYLVTIEWE
ncbi:hypothetical protein [Tannockella kyphosi]|uniref:hypothetical protein n=1 Tax=Tannockella kyphosi TaxID=2899121 RepID=UPI0020111E1F|nr:hypothetical protein [Tannockella kyphosi]